ncbi:MAG: hypothetical protein IJ461_04725 [Clostridia bacterium]|nr:hypothetical protein [Clostridia bacterium]
MKEPSQTSPFAELTLKEQQEKWIAWQSQHLEQRPLSKETAIPPVTLPTSKKKEAPAQESSASPAPFPPPRHSQYDAVLKRMNEARKKAVVWQKIT